MVDIYKELSKERKQLQAEGELPKWVTTLSYQMIIDKVLTEEYPTFKSVVNRIANAAAKHTEDPVEMAEGFFKIIWNGWLACSTPVIANMGTGKGCPVSCSGNFVSDNVHSFYESMTENAVLSQNGFGNSSCLDDIRPRGTEISRGGTASGVLPVLKANIQVSRDISQGSTRRGAWAGYISIEHGDFYEICEFIVAHPDDCNIGWNIHKTFIDKLEAGDKEAVERYQRALKVKMVTGKGYFFFIDKVNEQNPECYKDRGLTVKASNLCSEITLHSDEDHSFSCVLSSMNLAKYDEWKDTDAVRYAILFLDCVAQEMIEIGKDIPGMEKVVAFTEKSRALGLGTMGFHTYLQQRGVPFESLEASYMNQEIYSHIQCEAQIISAELAFIYGEPEWCGEDGLRHTHLTAVAPNMSSAIICGSVSQGVEPVYKNAYVQATASGEMQRINPILVEVMKELKVFNHENIQDIINNGGSVQHVDWLDEHKKAVFKTAFEIDQHVIIRLASARQKFICQGQSINLFFSADEDEAYISSVHKAAFLDPRLKALYYIRSEAGVTGSNGECESCSG
jgi:ribonucleoside-diphosphate reductase alpha chain